MQILRTALAAIAFGSVVIGAIPGQTLKNKNEPSQPSVIAVTAKVPSLAGEGESLQTKGSLRITLTSELYEAKAVWTEEIHRAGTVGLVLAPAPNAVYVEKTKVPHLVIKPASLMLHVHLENQLPHVFRGSGVAIQFRVAGKLRNIDPSGYVHLTNLILPPGREQEVTIVGPKLEEIPAPSTIGIAFYDVVTGMDQAGNVMEKQNFEWQLSYTTNTIQKEFPISPSQRFWILAGR